MKFKSYYWAIIAALAAVVIIVFVLPRVFTSSSASGDSPHGDQSNQSYDYTPVIQAYQDLLKSNANDDVALEGLGDLYMNMGQYSNAKDMFEKANAINPNDALYHGRLGEAYFSLGMTDVALRELNSGLSLDPNNQAILIDIGIIYGRTNKPDDARKMWQKAEDVNPNNSLSHTAKELIAQLDNPQSTTTAPPLTEHQP